MLAVRDSGKHIVLVIPAEAINHIADFMNFRLMNEGQKHISVAVDKAHFSLRRHFNLIELHLVDLSGVLDVLSSHLAGENVEDSNNLG